MTPSFVALPPSLPPPPPGRRISRRSASRFVMVVRAISAVAPRRWRAHTIQVRNASHPDSGGAVACPTRTPCGARLLGLRAIEPSATRRSTYYDLELRRHGSTQWSEPRHTTRTFDSRQLGIALSLRADGKSLTLRGDGSRVEQLLARSTSRGVARRACSSKVAHRSARNPTCTLPKPLLAPHSTCGWCRTRQRSDCTSSKVLRW